MNTQEARNLLNAQLQMLRKVSYTELKRRVEERTVQTQTVKGPTGIQYQMELQVFWDGKPNGNIRVRSTIDDGGWRSFWPLKDDFIMAPNGSFVDD